MNIYVDKEKRTTVAVMTNVQSDIYNYLYSLLRNRDVNSYEDIYSLDILKDITCKSVPHTLRAKAKCTPSDIFFEDIGMDLARARLLEKYHGYCLSILTKYMQYVNKHLNDRLIAAVNMMEEKYEKDNNILFDILDNVGALN